MTATLTAVTALCLCYDAVTAEETRLLETGYDIRTVQQLLGHKDVRTTMILRLRSGRVYTHVLNSGRTAVRSPLDV